ncbi:hypothetical protein TPL01_02720 [Sulfuriferula plumbiphila]|uniref:Uncharacterized protein n=1 Tax=Sulfuriferula plumbiphila TaxID=171865 RepID=A0A512L3T4_9PROT|nr:hypothetical protein [Sulfuriferula plumbiphila]BBP05569.1 hypothetical protein SFPGR_29910 [Sulfuriferula plumbiphila]GEP29134.1 hypothetical protein TPL01_02720 [Sulfuriferula plumbiphila]
MKASLENLKAARLALLALMIAAVLGVWLVHYALQAKQAAQHRLGQLQVTLSEAQRKLSQSGSEKDLVQQYLDAYHTLQRRGFIGPDQRLAWRDALADAGRRLAIRDLKFSIGPQQTYTGVVPVDVGKMVLHEAPVNLTGQLFDENDLDRLIDILASQPGGILGVRDCTLQRSNTHLPSLVEPLLQTQCSFVWYTLSPTVPSGSTP